MTDRAGIIAILGAAIAAWTYVRSTADASRETLRQRALASAFEDQGDLPWTGAALPVVARDKGGLLRMIRDHAKPKHTVRRRFEPPSLRRLRHDRRWTTTPRSGRPKREQETTRP